MLVWDMYDIVSTIVTTRLIKRVGMLVVVWDMYDIVSTIVPTHVDKKSWHASMGYV